MEYHWDKYAESKLRGRKKPPRAVRKLRKKQPKRPSGCWLWAAGLDLVLVALVTSGVRVWRRR